MRPRWLCSWRATISPIPRCSARRSHEAAGRRLGRRPLLDVDDQLHLWMNGAEHVEISRDRNGERCLAARLLVAGIEAELVRIHVGVMAQITVVVDDDDGLPARD